MSAILYLIVVIYGFFFALISFTGLQKHEDD